MMTIDEMEALPLPLSPEHRALVIQHRFEMWDDYSVGLLGCRALFKRRPMHGGVFDTGHFSLSSWSFEKAGLDEVHYYVIEDTAWHILGRGVTKGEAIGGAREILQSTDRITFARFITGACERRAEIARESAIARHLQRDEFRANLKLQSMPKSIPRRRREIFDASFGKCHYCAAPLALDGKWHIEHKMPRALMGTSKPSNLVASCVSCNHKKRDMTDVEFIAKQAGLSA